MSQEKIIERLGKEFADATKQATITDKMVQYARSKGVSYICANCTKFWRGIELGQAQCMAVHEKKKCGGPILMMTFPEYQGPLPRTTFPSICFVCGGEAIAGVKAGDSQELIGVCADHEAWLHEMRKYDKGKDKQRPIIMKVRTEA